MAKVSTLRQIGNQIRVQYDDGTVQVAYQSVNSELWVVGPMSGGGTDPGSGTLTDFYSIVTRITGTWEDHASYSRGGTDWGFAMNTPIKAPAAGTLVNYGNVDGAGLKSILIFDGSFPRQWPASTTLMNGVYTENATDPAKSVCIQHLNSQVPEGHYNVGEVIGYSGNSAGPGSTGDIHLHLHLLAGTTIDDRRLDFMKFLS